MRLLKKNYGTKNKMSVSGLTLALFSGTVLQAVSAPLKPIPADEGQAKLMQDVNAGQKSHKLTMKEAHKLRKDLAQVARKKAKMLADKNKLSAEDTEELKKEVNKISDKIHRLELEKQSH